MQGLSGPGPEDTGDAMGALVEDQPAEALRRALQGSKAGAVCLLG